MNKDAWNPQQYDKFKAERSQPFFDLLALVQKEPMNAVIDLGCGTGELTKHLHESLRPTTTLGIDSSEKMLAQAPEAEGLSFRKHTIENWQANAEFDLVFSNAALQWCSDHEALFKNISLALKPGGQLAIQMPFNQNYATHRIAREMGVDTHPLLHADAYAELLFSLGFREQKVFINVYGHILAGREDVIEWVKGTLLTRVEKTLEPAAYKDFLQEYRQRLFQELPEQKPFFYPFQRIFLWARR